MTTILINSPYYLHSPRCPEVPTRILHKFVENRGEGSGESRVKAVRDSPSTVH